MLYEFDSKRPRIDPSAYVSDSATIIGDVQIGARCYVGPGAIIRGDAKPIVIGEESAVEDRVIIHVGGAGTQGCIIGRRVTIGHGAIVHGNHLHDGANIGMGAIVSIYAEVGEYAVVAEGAVVKRGQVVPPRAVVGGAPAVKLRELQDKDIDSWEKSKQTYIDLAAKCLSPSAPRKPRNKKGPHPQQRMGALALSAGRAAESPAQERCRSKALFAPAWHILC